MLTDKERMLMTIISALNLYAPFDWDISKGVYLDKHFFNQEEKMKPGDIVIAGTNLRMHEFTVGVFEQYVGRTDEHEAYYVIRELGSANTCNYYNESFSVLRGIRENPTFGPQLLEADQYAFHRKVEKSFRLGGEYWHKYDRVDFPEKHHATIYVRVKWWASNRTDEENIKDFNHGYRPFHFDMHWTKKTPIKAILEEMKAHGYGKEAIQIDR